MVLFHLKKGRNLSLGHGSQKEIRRNHILTINIRTAFNLPKINRLACDTILRMIETHQIQIDGANIIYKTVGDKIKPTLVFLHGWPGISLAKSNLLEELAKEHFVIAPIHPGYLESEPLGTYTNIIDQYADVVFLILKKENREKDKLILIGQSFGATVASAFAEKYPDHIKGLVFVSAFMCTKKQDLVRKTLWNFGGLIIRSFLYLPTFFKKAGLYAFFGVKSANYNWKFNNALIRARIGLIDNSTKIFRESMKKDGNLLDRDYGNFPIIFCWGNRDGEKVNIYGYSPMSEAEKIFRKLKSRGIRTEFVVLDGGHGILYENPERVLLQINQALLRLGV
jgi:pimeloyl-ACP methyl ester carboxylesterase